MSALLELLVTEGPLAGRRFPVPAGGLRLGRSSTCEISIPDPALSRNHCLFETRDGGLWVTDLASANGTVVNDVQLGADSFPLRPGDSVFAGDSALRAVPAGGDAADGGGVPSATPPSPKVDLGLGGGAPPSGAGEDAPGAGGGARPPLARYVLWGVAALSVLASVALILFPASPDADAPVLEAQAGDMGELHSFSYEKVEAGPRSIFRYALSYDDRSKTLQVRVDDVPTGRQVEESAELSDDARARLAEIFSSPELYRLAPEYAGSAPESGAFRSFAMHMVRARRVLDVSIANAPEPGPFQDMRMRLEAFADSELGLFAIHMPVEALRKRSAEACRVADAKWVLRGSSVVNIAEALRKYDEALNYLKTVNPKPADYESIRERRKMVQETLDDEFRRHRVNAEQAIGTQNWRLAQEELRVLLELVADKNDDRNKEAARKLLEVEARMKSNR